MGSLNFRRRTISYLEGENILPSNLMKDRVEDYAEQVAAFGEFEIGESPADLAKKFGGKIHFAQMDDWKDENGSIFVHEESDFDIILPLYTSPRRDTFTVAHELGHYFLHSNQGENPIVAYRKGSTRIEWEANWFAAALLMPQTPFRKACEKTDDIARLAAKFNVSQDAVKVRRDALGIRD